MPRGAARRSRASDELFGLQQQPACWLRSRLGPKESLSAAVPAPAAGFASLLASAEMLVAAERGSSADLQTASMHAAQKTAGIRQLRRHLATSQLKQHQPHDTHMTIANCDDKGKLNKVCGGGAVLPGVAVLRVLRTHTHAGQTLVPSCRETF